MAPECKQVIGFTSIEASANYAENSGASAGLLDCTRDSCALAFLPDLWRPIVSSFPKSLSSIKVQFSGSINMQGVSITELHELSTTRKGMFNNLINVQRVQD
jgi:hypothetical protein